MAAQPRIVFLRHRLGIGGSERLVVDAAAELQRRGCSVRVLVPDCRDRQFGEIDRGEIPVSVKPSFLPQSIGGRARTPLAVARTLLAARGLYQKGESPDLVFCDVVPHVIPLVRLMIRVPVLYYCHFPDQLLVPDWRSSALYRLYRRPINALEQRGTRLADRVLANSRFTMSRMRTVFPSLPESHIRVLHPGVPPARLRRPALGHGTPTVQILSISRFDPRKNLAAALHAFAFVRARSDEALRPRLRLVLAGDASLPGDQGLLSRLRTTRSDLGLDTAVDFVLSPSDDERDRLIASSWCVLYTPAEEHFGYVPLEAMAAGCPVVASGCGGPTETIVDGVTGLLCPPTPEGFARAVARLVEAPELANRLGAAGPPHVTARFSLERFGDELEATVREMTGCHRP